MGASCSIACCCGAPQTCGCGNLARGGGPVVAGVPVAVGETNLCLGASPNTPSLRGEAVEANQARLARRLAETGPVKTWNRGSLSEVEKSYVFWRAHGKCVDCGVSMRFLWNSSPHCFTIDHIRPKSCAATMPRRDAVLCIWSLANMQAMCSRCNSKKGDTPNPLEHLHASIARDLGV